jgi:hypothetical protein
MPLTSADLQFVRNSCGDADSNDYYNTDAELHDLYDGRAAGNVDATIVWALRWMKAKAFRKVNFTNADTGDTHSRKQEFDHICLLLEMWENMTGLSSSTSSAGVVTTGEISLGIDEEDSYTTNP